MRILIAGQSCSGKSTFLKFCHQSGLFDSLSIIDLDEHLKKNFIPHGDQVLFKDQDSLKAFRQKEGEALRSLLEKEINSLIALGGGTLDNFDREEIQEFESRGIILFHFKADLEEILEKVVKLQRPLSKVLDFADLKKLFEKRQEKLDSISRVLPSDNFQTSLKILQEFISNPCQK